MAQRRAGGTGDSARGAAAVVLGALRTPFGRRGECLGDWHPVDLAAQLLTELIAATGLDPSLVDDVVMGCTSQVGAQAGNIGRRSALAAGWPPGVPGATVDRQSASSAQAVHWAAQAVISGAQRFVVAGGVEVMTAVPMGAPLAQPAVGKPLGHRLTERYRGGGGLLPPGLAAEEVARRWRLSRAALDAWVLRSFEKALASQAVLPPYMVPVLRAPAQAADGRADQARPRVRMRGGVGKGLLTRDEALERPLRRPEMRKLRPAYLEGGVVTAANMAAEGDGAAAVLVSSAAHAASAGLAPKARFVSFATAGEEPDIWPMAAVPAARVALARAGIAAADVDRWYVHESSAAAVLAWSAATGVDLAKVNVEGGALASTAPVGAAGAGLFAPAVAGLADSTNGLAVVCCAGEGGVATACVLARA